MLLNQFFLSIGDLDEASRLTRGDHGDLFKEEVNRGFYHVAAFIMLDAIASTTVPNSERLVTYTKERRPRYHCRLRFQILHATIYSQLTSSLTSR